MKVKYIGDYYKVVLCKNKVYDVLSVENGTYRIATEVDDDDNPADVAEYGVGALFSANEFEIVED